MIEKKDIFDLIEKQFSGNISKEERAELEIWYHADSKHKNQYKQYYTILKYLHIHSNKSGFESDIEEAYSRFIKQTGQSSEKKTSRFSFTTWLRYAAVFIIAFALSSSLFFFRNKSNTADLLVQTIEIPFGSKSKVVLPDGTTVWLNSGSRLSYSENFGRAGREVTLDGEGYFDVTRNESLPFYVQSGKVKIHVLGTKFNFKSYLEDESARVTLLEGSLAVNNNDDNIMLVPNQQALIDRNENKVSVKKVDAVAYAKWTEPKSEILEVEKIGDDAVKASIRTPSITLRNILFFDEEPLSQIVRDLERVYNVKIDIRDIALQNELFYGDFRNEETITEILDIMAKNNFLQYSIEDDEIIITRK